MAIGATVESVCLHRLFDPFAKLLEDSPAELFAHGNRKFRPHLFVKDGEPRGSVELFWCAGTFWRGHSNKAQAVVFNEPFEMGIDPLQRAATISGKESGWTHFPQKQLGHDL